VTQKRSSQGRLGKGRGKCRNPGYYQVKQHIIRLNFKSVPKYLKIIPKLEEAMNHPSYKILDSFYSAFGHLFHKFTLLDDVDFKLVRLSRQLHSIATNRAHMIRF